MVRRGSDHQLLSAAGKSQLNSPFNIFFTPTIRYGDLADPSPRSAKRSSVSVSLPAARRGASVEESTGERTERLDAV